jgi:hypothetical protein
MTLTAYDASGYLKAAQDAGTFLYFVLWTPILKCYKFRK